MSKSLLDEAEKKSLKTQSSSSPTYEAGVTLFG